jgi:hypothetical protein
MNDDSRDPVVNKPKQQPTETPTKKRELSLAEEVAMELRDWVEKGHCKLAEGNEILPLPKVH